MYRNIFKEKKNICYIKKMSKNGLKDIKTNNNNNNNMFENVFK